MNPVSKYYDLTLNHYQRFWHLDDAKAIHYGIWYKDTKKFSEALKNTNYHLSKLLQPKPTDHILDAGCGVGGSALHVAKEYHCSVTGITINAKQVALATQFAKTEGLLDKVDFVHGDYHQLPFQDNHFDAVWTLESMQTSHNKNLLFSEISRVLKPGGKYVVGDMVKSYPFPIKEKPALRIVMHGWAMQDLCTLEELETIADNNGLTMTLAHDDTPLVVKSMKKMYWAGILGAVGTFFYSLFNKPTYYSRFHYKTGIQQYRAYQQGLWQYYTLVFTKK